MKITVTRDDGDAQDITTLVQIAYDVATHSMDWGSGFLDIEETDGLIMLALACGFPDCEEKIAEVWKDRLGDYSDRQRLADERGVATWNLEATDEDRAEFVRNLIHTYTPSGGEG